MSDNFLGEDFDYMNAFYKPLEDGGPGMGASASDIFSNIKGTIAYAGALIVHEKSGNTSVQKNGGVLGNAYFLNTNIECENDDEDADERTVNRHIYISNRPTGKMDALNGLIPNMVRAPTGLIPGMMSNIQRTNPSGLLNAVLPSNPDDSKCQSVTLDIHTQNVNGRVVKTSESNFMTKYDIKKVDPCSFMTNENPLTKKTGTDCNETFSSMNQPIEEEIVEENNYSKMPDDQLMQLYLSSLTLLGLYLVLKFINKR